MNEKIKIMKKPVKRRSLREKKLKVMKDPDINF